MLVTGCLLAPILYWNYSNDFITYSYQAGRVGLGAIQWDSLLREISGEALYNNPIIFTLFTLACIAMIKQRRFVQLPDQRLLSLLSFPLMAVVLLISLFRDTLPHWTGPAYATVIPLVAVFITTKPERAAGASLLRPVKWALALTIFLLLTALYVVKWLPLSIGSKDPEKLGKNDVTLDMNGWTQFGKQFDSLYRHDVQKGIMKNHSFLLSDYWFPAAHINYYVARKYDLNFLAIGSLSSIHHYAWLNELRPFLNNGDDAYFITISNFYNQPGEVLSTQFQTVLPPSTITQFRFGVPVRNFVIFRMKNYQGKIPRSGVIK